MPKRLTKPTDVPAARQGLVDMLWNFYVAARRPSTRTIAAAIQSLDEEQRKGTANHETVRGTLKGETVGAWETVEVIFLGLCELADVDPDDIDPQDGFSYDNEPDLPHRERLYQHWNHALDETPTRGAPRTRTERAAAEERARLEHLRQQRAFSDEPPF